MQRSKFIAIGLTALSIILSAALAQAAERCVLAELFTITG
jgi:hypothetical protein